MRQFRLIFAAFSCIFITTTILPSATPCQSGRGRPKVPTREPAAPSPPPVRVPETTAVAKQEQAGNNSRFVLRNGMTVIISEQHATPIAAAVAYFKVGASEEAAANDITRLLERIQLARPAGHITIDAWRFGAVHGADSAYDHVITSPEKIKEALALQARRVELLQQEMGGARREPTFIHDDPSLYAIARLHSLAFAEQPGVGLAKTMQEVSSSTARDQPAQSHQTYLRPENLIVSVVGDIPTFSTLVEIQLLYANFKAGVGDQVDIKPKTADSRLAKPSRPLTPRGAPAHEGTPDVGSPALIDPRPLNSGPSQTAATAGTNKPAIETGQTKLRYGADRGDINQSIVSVGYRVPGLGAKDWPTIEVLSAIIGQGRGSRLHRSLLDSQAVVTRIKSNYLARTHAGLLALQIWPGANALDKAESALFKEIDRLRRELPTEAEMARAKALAEKRFVDQTGAYLGRALALARAETAHGGFRAALNYRKLIHAVRPEEVQQAAAKYLALANTSVHEYEPYAAEARTFDADRFAATVLAWAPTFGQAVDAKDVRPAEANSSIALVAQGVERSSQEQAALESMQPLPVKDFSTLNGPRAFVREDHSQPSVTVALLFQGGRVLEDNSTSGITELMLRSMLFGTPRRTSAQAAQELEQRGANIEVIAEPDLYGFVLSVLSRNAEGALRILRDLIEQPAFRDEDIERARAAQMALIRANKDVWVVRSRKLLFEALFPGHAYSFPAHGREESVAKLTADQIRQWYQRAIERQLPLAIIVGDTDGSALVSGHIAEGFRRRDLDRSLQIKVPHPSKPAERVEQRRSNQTALAIGFAGPKRDSNDHIVIELIESAMNGPAGKLQSDVVNKQRLAQWMSLNNESLFLADVIYVRILTSSENEQRARTAFLAELERVARTGLTADEIAAAQDVARASRLSLLQSQTVRALEYARAIMYQREASEVDTFSDRLSKVTAEDVKRVLSLYFKPSSASAGVVRGTPSQAAQSPPKQD